MEEGVFLEKASFSLFCVFFHQVDFFVVYPQFVWYYCQQKGCCKRTNVRVVSRFDTSSLGYVDR